MRRLPLRDITTASRTAAARVTSTKAEEPCEHESRKEPLLPVQTDFIVFVWGPIPQ